MHLVVDRIIHKPCTDTCGGLRIEPVTIEKRVPDAVDLDFSVPNFWTEYIFMIL